MNLISEHRVPLSLARPRIDKDRHNGMANALRSLAIDAIEAAQSGHPGLPLGAADIVTVLFAHFMSFDPTRPDWPDRDRFVLSAGHGSMLLYALLHLTGYADMSLSDIKSFRQLGSKTPGHPEFGSASGIEMTTGPLGQGLATAVGMAIAERHLAAHFGTDIVDHYTYVLASDGDLMEGISHEAIALAGHLKLDRLIVLFDDNDITIDGPLFLTDSVDQIRRFQACGWDAVRVDGHDPEAIASAIAEARKSTRPSLIACKTLIGYGSPSKQGKSSAHGAPLGMQEARATKIALGCSPLPFDIRPDVLDAWRLVGLQGAKVRKAWEQRFKEQDSELRRSFERRIARQIPSSCLDQIIQAHKKQLVTSPLSVSTRKASELALNVITPALPEMVGGSADLTGSNNTRAESMVPLSASDYSGRFIHYGIREHGMAAAMNGMALHGGIIPYSGTFLVFSDYARPAIRLSALMKQHVIYVMTHDSIGLGEDGSTHQPVEHLLSLRAIPNLLVMRPCDAVETAECWQVAIQRQDGPSLIALSRQDLPQLRRSHESHNLSSQGGYLLTPASQSPRVTLIATGSEVHIAAKAQQILETEKIATALVSMPCRELFSLQPEEYRHRVVAPQSLCLAIEAGSSLGWERYLGSCGIIVGIDQFGESGSCDNLYAHFGLTPDAIVSTVRHSLIVPITGNKKSREKT